MFTLLKGKASGYAEQQKVRTVLGRLPTTRLCSIQPPPRRHGIQAVPYKNFAQH
ncbi:MAG: hypothetical protein SLRJCFUN_000151 [Candidatus Fervidibacter sp.]